MLLVLDRLGALSEKVKRALRVFKNFSITVGPDGSLSGGINVDPEVGVPQLPGLAGNAKSLQSACSPSRWSVRWHPMKQGWP